MEQYVRYVGILEIKKVMSDTFFRHKDKELINLVLTDADWNCIAQLIEVLAPLKEATLLARLKMANPLKILLWFEIFGSKF